MNKLIIAIAAVAVFTGFQVAEANTTCDPSKVDLVTTLVQCNGNDPMMVTMPWGLTGAQTPILKAGETVTDEAGVTDICPKWYFTNCFDISRTDYYRNYMRNLAKQLLANGTLTHYERFQYQNWLTR